MDAVEAAGAPVFLQPSQASTYVTANLFKNA